MTEKYNAKEELEKTAKRIKKVSQTRHNAAARLALEHRLSIASIAIMSVFIIIFTIFDVSNCDIPKETKLDKDLVVVSLSIFVIIITLLESGKNYRLHIHKFKTCALNLDKLERKIKVYLLTKQDYLDHLKKMNKEYSKCLEKCGLNHRTKDYFYTLWCDFDLFKEKHPWGKCIIFSSEKDKKLHSNIIQKILFCFSSIIFKFIYWLRSGWLFLTLIFSGPYFIFKYIHYCDFDILYLIMPEWAYELLV
jgi:hypothetical protein